VSDPETPDYYEMLQISPRADLATIERVFRHLAKRCHPDNVDSGDADLFAALLEAYRTLSNPERRAAYDVQYARAREANWRVFDQQSVVDGVHGDRRIRSAILSLLYTARRNDPDRPGMGTSNLERLLGCAEEHMKFHVWYLKELGLLQRLENGQLAITVAGVERVMESGGPAPGGLHLLGSGGQNGAPQAAHSDWSAAR
jgi:curved DNA-binding protein